MTILSEQDILNYSNNGFLIKKNFFNESEALEIKKWIDDYQKRDPLDWSGKENAYYETSLLDEKSRILSRIEKFADFHSGLKNIAESSRLLDHLQDLVGEECILFKEKINLKQPGGNGFRTHQDIVSRWMILQAISSMFLSLLMNVQLKMVVWKSQKDLQRKN